MYVIKPHGVLEYIYVFLDSLEYLVDFMILTPKNNLVGHLLILGIPWLARVNAFTSGRLGDLFISDGSSTKKFILYPLGKTMIEVENEEWIDNDNDIQPVFTVAKINEEDQILNSIENNEPSL